MSTHRNTFNNIWIFDVNKELGMSPCGYYLHQYSSTISLYSNHLLSVSSGLCTPAGITLCMRQTNERRRYNVSSSLIGWAHTLNNPWPRWHMLIVGVFIASCCVCRCSGACLRQINNRHTINSLMNYNILHVFSTTIYLFGFNEQTVFCMDHPAHVFIQWETTLHREVVYH